MPGASYLWGIDAGGVPAVGPVEVLSPKSRVHDVSAAPVPGVLAAPLKVTSRGASPDVGLADNLAVGGDDSALVGAARLGPVVGRVVVVVPDVVVGAPGSADVVVVAVGPSVVGVLVVVSAGTFTTVGAGDVVEVVVRGGDVVAGELDGTLTVVVVPGAAGPELGDEGVADGDCELREPPGAALAACAPPWTGKVRSDRRVITPISPSSDRCVSDALAGFRPDPTPDAERERRLKIPPANMWPCRPTRHERSCFQPRLSCRDGTPASLPRSPELSHEIDNAL